LIFHSSSLLSTFVDIMVAVKKIDFDLDLEVDFKTFSY
jgi:hypothetical protein